MKWFQRNKWAAAGAILSCTITTAIIAGTSSINVNDNTGTSKTYAVTTNGGGNFVTQTTVCDGTAAANCAAVSAGGALTASPVGGSNFVAPVQIGSSITLTTSGTSGSNFVAPVQIGSSITLPTSPAAGIITPVSPSAGSNYVAPIQIGSAPTLVVSNSSTALVTPVNCISGCAGAGTTITSQAAASLVTQVTIPQGFDVTQGAQADAACGSDTGTCTVVALIKRLNQIVDGSIPAGSNTIGNVGLAAQSTGGCTSTYVTASTSSVLTQIKASAGTLCWIRIINASPVTALVKVYDSASLGQDHIVCGSTTVLPVSYDVAQPNTVSPGLVGNLGPYGMALSTGIDICLSGFSGSFSMSDTTSLTTSAVIVNVGTK